MGLDIFGYAGCTTVKRAREWAENARDDVNYTHFNKVPDLAASLEGWVEKAGMDSVFNERAQTLKKMKDTEREAILASDQAKMAAMIADPRLIKRPVGTDGKTVLTGFDSEQWQFAFGK